MESVTFNGCLCKSDYGFRVKSFFSPETEPFIFLSRTGRIIQIRLLPVAYIKEVSEHFNLFPLLSGSQKGSNRLPQELSEQIEKCGLDSSYCMYCHPQVIGLKATSAGILLAVFLPDQTKDVVVFSQTLSPDQILCFIKEFPYFLTARHFADPGMTGIVLHYDNIPGEERPVGTAEVQQHAVATCYGDHCHLGYNWCSFNYFAIHIK